MGYILLISSLLLFCCAIVRVTDYTRTIGTNVAVTLLFCLGSGIFWIAVHVFTYSFMEATNRQVIKFKRSEKKHLISLGAARLTLILSAVFSFIFCIVPTGMLNNRSANDFLILGSIHYLGLGVLIFTTGIYFLPRFTSALQKELEQVPSEIKLGVSRVPLDKLLLKVKFFNREVRRQVILQLLFALLFG